MSYTAVRILTVAFIVAALVGCSKAEYDFKALGFASKGDMEAAFSKGYHTKQKLDEMITPPAAVVAAPPAQVQPAPASEPAPQPQAAVASQAAPPPQAPTSEAIASCDSVRVCADAMLAAAKREALPGAMESALRIDAMPKPQRGDRKLARKLNAEGLESLKQRRLPEAAATLSKALQADPGDEEIISNLIYAYSEDSNFTKAEQLAYDGLLLNPRRANIWLPLAIAKQKQNKPNEALQAMWLAWQFSGDKQRMLNLLDKRIAEETDGGLKSMYGNAKAWAVDGKKPSF